MGGEGETPSGNRMGWESVLWWCDGVEWLLEVNDGPRGAGDGVFHVGEYEVWWGRVYCCVGVV